MIPKLFNLCCQGRIEGERGRSTNERKGKKGNAVLKFATVAINKRGVTGVFMV
jgi:hypothetical protein